MMKEKCKYASKVRFASHHINYIAISRGVDYIFTSVWRERQAHDGEAQV